MVKRDPRTKALQELLDNINSDPKNLELILNSGLLTPRQVELIRIILDYNGLKVNGNK